MDKSRLETKVGLFVFIGLVLLAGMLVLFSKGTSLLSSTYTLKLHTTNIGGLKEQAAVQLAGVPVGNVREINLDSSGTNVTVILQIYKRYPIYSDARFVIEASGFLGDQYVSVVPTANTPPALNDGADVQCEPPFNLQEVARGAAGFIQRLDGTAKKLDASVSDLRSQVLNAQTLANFGDAITNLRVFTEQAIGTIGEINGIINTNGGQVGSAVSNFVVFSTQLNHLGDSAQDILATNGATITAATKNIENITSNAQQLVSDLQAGKGVAGTLLQDNETMTNLQILAANLSIASSNLNQFGLWHFLWAHSHPAASVSARPSSKSP